MSRREGQAGNLRRAFTLIELLVVISILGILAALSVPAIKNLGKSNIGISASRQLLDDIGRARQLAMSQRTTVYMVFVPTNFFNTTFWNNLTAMSLPERNFALATATNLIPNQLTGYSFISYGQLGDQPGQHAWHYLSSTWQSLPEGTFISAQKFMPASRLDIPQWRSDCGTYGIPIDDWRRPLTQIYSFTNLLVPFPTEQSPAILMPCIAFNYLGRLVSEYDGGDPNNPGSFHNAYIPLAQGTIGYGRDPSSKIPQPTTVSSTDIIETPPGNSTNISYNVIHIDALTGRATLKFFRVQ